MTTPNLFTDVTPSRVKLYVDGGCSKNYQKDMSLRDMVAVVTDAEGEVVSSRIERGGSNNIAELIAVRDALVYCQAKQIARVHIISDSQNTLAWVNGSWSKGDRYTVGKAVNDRGWVLRLLDEIRRLRQTPIVLTLEWVGRDENLAGHFIEQQHGL